MIFGSATKWRCRDTHNLYMRVKSTVHLDDATFARILSRYDTYLDMFYVAEHHCRQYICAD